MARRNLKPFPRCTRPRMPGVLLRCDLDGRGDGAASEHGIDVGTKPPKSPKPVGDRASRVGWTWGSPRRSLARAASGTTGQAKTGRDPHTHTADTLVMTVPEWSCRYGFACATTRKLIAEGITSGGAGGDLGLMGGAVDTIRRSLGRRANQS